ncbi:hypothetical protein HY213_01060 [Candidatus Peregrinibacteria bacterium]|nr:hypothetical protein [Candidatus Peregrinibacteria bacterium]
MAKRTTKKITSKKTAKKSKIMKKKATHAVAKKVVAKKSPPKKKSRVITTAKKKMVTSASKKVTEKMLGKVVHYYDKIGVAIVDLKAPLALGETVVLKKGNFVLTQRVSSLQIEHVPILRAKKGDVVGLKVDEEVSEGAVVVPV